MADQAHEWTDEQIDRLHRRLAREYSQAAMEMRTKLNSYLEDYEYANQSWKDAVRSGEATREDYRDWLASQVSKKRYAVDMTNKLAEDALGVDKRAFEIINDTLPQVYAENANYAAYSIESGIGRDTGGFALYDQDTVRRLMTMGENDQVIHEVIPIGPPNTPLQSLRVNLDAAKDVRWNRQKFTSAITQSILQGESIPNTAKRLAGVLNMDKNMATRAARTAMTSAENAGRVDSYKRAERIGITLEQEWMATLDERTRHSHRVIDGQHVRVGAKFSNGLSFPGDPSGPGEEIWNCRCTLVAWLPDVGPEDNQRWSRLPEGMTYEQWKGAKEDEQRAIEGGTASRYTNMGNPLWSQLGPVDRDAVAGKVDELLSGSHGKAAQLWAKMEQHLKMADPFETSGAYFSPRDGVHMHVQRSLENVGDRGALSTWFHEFGHHIDNSFMRMNGGHGYESSQYDDNAFGKTLKREVEAYIRSVQKADNDTLRSLKANRDLQGLFDGKFIGTYDIDGMANRIAVRDYYEILAHINDNDWLLSRASDYDYWRDSMARRFRTIANTPLGQREDKVWSVFSHLTGVPERNVPIQVARDKVGREITDGGRNIQLALGDIYEGATRGKCQDTYGHGRNYWDSEGRNLSEEAFAEFFSAECIYSERPEILDTMIQRFPDSYATYQQIVEAMLNG